MFVQLTIGDRRAGFAQEGPEYQLSEALAELRPVLAITLNDDSRVGNNRRPCLNHLLL